MKLPRYKNYQQPESDWQEEIPKGWKSLALGRLFCRVKRTGFENEELLSVYRDLGVILKSSRDDNFNKPSDDLTPYQLVQPGELVMNKMKAWQGSIAVSEYRGIVSPAYFVYQPWKAIDERMHSRYVHYLLRSPIYIAQYLRQSKGIRVSQWDLDPEQFERIEVLLPSLEEQKQIAAFLDYETAKIDVLIEKQQQLIALLEEKRQAVISHVVTNGLNPNAPMRDSGIEWLGEVPEHWVVKKLGHLGRVQNGLNIAGDAFGSGDPFVSYGDVYNNVNVPETPAGLVKSTADDQKKCSLDIGDVLFTRTSESVDDIGVASTCLSPIPRSTFAGFLIRFRPNRGTFDPNYSTYLFRNQAVQGHFSGTMNIVTRASLSQDVLKMLPICIPPLREQAEIGEHLDSSSDEFDDLEDKLVSQHTLLKERRIALISAAVTGKIDVRAWKPPPAGIEYETEMEVA